ncbi:TRAP transporter large permease [Oceaniglobus trochenteri]|uniref:TRAP transporter large permease n=1 Tax=Oceaniglobus trochenteri TaxID=2763260 RepID=UPI001CFFE6C4|nr:TRAP transporter large permease [Oceaniglobus trochenteri]
MMTFLPVLVMLVLMALNTHVAFAIGIAALTFFFTAQGVPQEIFIQRMVSVTQSFPILAVPLFILAGILMNHSGMTRRMMALADSLVGHMVGGLAQVNVILSVLMGGMSGSSNADAAMQAKILVPEMEAKGYGRAFSGAVTATSSVIAPIIPPGIGMVIYGFLADVSIGRLFLGGVIPGLLMGAALMVVVTLVSRRRGYLPAREAPATARERGAALWSSLWALGLPVGIIGGIRFGILTPTEAGAIAVIYALFVGFVVYREMKLADLPAILSDATLSTAVIMLIICAAQAFGFYMSWERIPTIAGQALLSFTENPVLLLLAINLFLVLVGMLVEGTAALIILTPLLAPLAASVGIDPVHFGIVMVVNLTIAAVTPPVGTLIYTTSTIIRCDIGSFVRESLPLLAALFAVLLLISLFPAIVLFLPNLLMS